MSFRRKQRAFKGRYGSARARGSVYRSGARTARSASALRSARNRFMGGSGGRRRSNARTGGFLGIEVKFYDTALVGATLTAPTDATAGEHNPSATLNFCTMAQGDGESQRDGRKALVKSVYVTGMISVAALINQTALKEQPVVYIALVHDKQTNGAQIVSEEVFANPAGSNITATSPLRNLQHSSRFTVLDRTTVILPQQEASYDGSNLELGGTMTPFMLSWKGAMPITYDGTTSAVANITDNSIQLIAWCNTVGQIPLLSYNARTRFVG